MAWKDRVPVGSVPLYEWVGVADVVTTELHNKRLAVSSEMELMRLPGELHLAVFRATADRDRLKVGRFFCDVQAVGVSEAPFHDESGQVCKTCRANYAKEKP